tara:strand:- start:45 stop:323 length:279 start_codon:yes stop_codon:yes gene_type:complete
MNKSAIAIFEEYCDSVKLLSKDTIEVQVQGKYFTELYIRVMLHGLTCVSIMSNERDIHIVTFGCSGLYGGPFDDMLGDELGDDDSDWWKCQD